MLHYAVCNVLVSHVFCLYVLAAAAIVADCSVLLLPHPGLTHKPHPPPSHRCQCCVSQPE